MSGSPHAQQTKLEGAGDWLGLQNKIFTRWVNQKLAVRKEKVADCVKDFSAGTPLVSLLEILSEKTFDKKLTQAPKMKVQKIDNVNLALGFVWSVGVKMELKPSAENIVDGDQKMILALVWAIMLKYIKFGDDTEEKLDAKDALLMWVQNQVFSYKSKGVVVEDLTKSFHNGLALCALMHKFRPKGLDFDKLDAGNGKANLQLAMKAAERYFGLEQYLTAEEVQKLDEKSMLVFISEYYYGIAKLRKQDLAARRITKLIKYTQTNDGMKSKYNDDGKQEGAQIARVLAILNDTTIDNTMSGAKKKLDEFYEYKTKDKGPIISGFLSLESLYNQLAIRLKDHHRPEFKPADGVQSVEQLRGALAALEKRESERKVELHAELNRQTKLAKINEQHQARFDNLKQWYGEKKAYLTTKESIDSIGAAEYHLNALAAYRAESEAVQASSLAELKRNGNYLADEKFEFISAVKGRESELDGNFAELGNLAAEKLKVLEDDLAREIFKAKVLNWAQQHVDRHGKLKLWLAEKKAFLEKKESIGSIADAELHLSLLRAYEEEREGLVGASVPPLKQLGQDILAAKYETSYSRYVFEKPQDIKDREAFVDATLAELATLSATKLKVLQDDLARETFKEKLRQGNQQHVEKHKKISAWIATNRAYLQVKEAVDSIGDATKNLQTIKAYAADKVDVTNLNVAALKKLGQEILTDKYQTALSSYVFPTPEEITGREAEVAAAWVELDGLYGTKLAILQDDLAREEFREKLRLWNESHIDKFKKLNVFIGESAAYLNKKEPVDSVAEAQVNLAKIQSYQRDQRDMYELSVRALKELGNQILVAKYETALSSFTFKTPEEIKQREAEIEASFNKLTDLSKAKLAVLEDDLAREEFREKLRQRNKLHVDKHGKIARWISQSKSYLEKKEPVNSISDAEVNLNTLHTWEADKSDMTTGDVVALKKLGAEIITAKYETNLSSYVFPTPQEIKSRESEVDDAWVTLAQLCNTKLAVLEDDLAREKFKQKLRQWNSEHIDKHKQISAWITTNRAYLQKKEPVDSVADAQGNLQALRTYEADKVDVANLNVAAMKALGADILNAKYQTSLSSFVFETPQEIKGREGEVADAWVELSKLSATKLEVLEDDLAREIFREKLRLSNEQHIAKHAKISAWVADSEAYLKKKEPVDSIAEAQVNLAVLHAYNRDQGDMNNLNVNALKQLGADIIKDKYETKLSSWVFPTPDEIRAREAQIDANFQNLTSLSKTKLEVLEDDLAREQFKAKVRQWNSNHVEKHKIINSWIGDSTKYLMTTEEANSVVQAHTNLDRLAAYDADKVDMTNVNVTTLKKTGKDILEAKYESKLSSYLFEQPDEVRKREKYVDDQWVNMSGMSAAKKAVLDSDLQREQTKEKLRLDFANLARDFTRFAKDAVDDAAATHFGFTLQAVEAYAIAANNAAVVAELGKKQAADKELNDKIEEMEVKENVYTKLTRADLAAASKSVNDALDARKSRFEEELARLRADDALCRQFAAKVDPFAKEMEANKSTVDQMYGKATLEQQLAQVDQFLHNITRDVTLPELKALQDKIDERKIAHNPHSLLTVLDAEVLWKQYAVFLNTKKATLEEEIKSKNMRGLSDRDMEEIKQQFEQFDKSKNGVLEKNEFKACLYSLGHEKNNHDVVAIMQKFGATDAKGIVFNGFKEFMIGELGDTDTRNDIMNGFLLLANDNPSVITVEPLSDTMKDPEVDYLKQNCKQAGNGLDYKTWTEEVFAR